MAMNKEESLPPCERQGLPAKKLYQRKGLFAAFKYTTKSRNYSGSTVGRLLGASVFRRVLHRGAFRIASQKELDAINEADLSELRFAGLIIDGINIAGRNTS